MHTARKGRSLMNGYLFAQGRVGGNLWHVNWGLKGSWNSESWKTDTTTGHPGRRNSSSRDVKLWPELDPSHSAFWELQPWFLAPSPAVPFPACLSDILVQQKEFRVQNHVDLKSSSKFSVLTGIKSSIFTYSHWTSVSPFIKQEPHL